MRVTPPAVAALAEDDLRAVLDDLGDRLARRDIGHDRAEGEPHDAMLPVLPKLVRAEPVLAALGLPVGLVLVVHEVVRVDVADEDDVAAPPAVAAVGAAPGLVFFPAEAHAAAPAVTGLKFNCALVDKHSGDNTEARAFAKGYPPPSRSGANQTFAMTVSARRP